MASLRTIGSTTFTTPTEHEIVFTRVFDAPRALLWDAWTSPDHLPRWMLGPDGWTMPVCEVDLRPGGAWRFVWRRGDGSEMGMRGEYRELSRPERLVHTEAWGGDWPETRNTLLLGEEEEGRTAVTSIVHYPTRAARDAALDTGMLGGVATSFDRLADYLESLARGDAPGG